MKKKSIYVVLVAAIMVSIASACSSDKDDDNNSKEFADPIVYRIYTDYISDINDETGVVWVDYFNGNTYIDGANGNRYYLAATEKFINEIQPMLEKEGVLVEGNNVKFSGKVYDSDERWIPGLEWRLENYGWNEGAKEAAAHGLYNFELPTIGHTFWLVDDFTITKAE